MSLPIFTLTTERLTIRPFVADDFEAIHRVLNTAFGANMPEARRRQWLDWTILAYPAQASLYNPPYGERAIVLTSTGELIGAVGFVPSYGPFEQLPYFRARLSVPPTGRYTPEWGLFWGVDPAHQRRGYATEAARAMIDYAFAEMNLARIVATTEYDNEASMAVMRRLGMSIERNPHPEPDWFQVVGVLENNEG